MTTSWRDGLARVAGAAVVLPRAGARAATRACTADGRVAHHCRLALCDFRRDCVLADIDLDERAVTDALWIPRSLLGQLHEVPSLGSANSRPTELPTATALTARLIRGVRAVSRACEALCPVAEVANDVSNPGGLAVLVRLEILAPHRSGSPDEAAWQECRLTPRSECQPAPAQEDDCDGERRRGQCQSCALSVRLSQPCADRPQGQAAESSRPEDDKDSHREPPERNERLQSRTLARARQRRATARDRFCQSPNTTSPVSVSVSPDLRERHALSHGSSSKIGGRKRRTSLGDRIFACYDCRRSFHERTAGSLSHLQDPTDTVTMAVLWRLKCKLRLRDVPLPEFWRSLTAARVCSSAVGSDRSAPWTYKQWLSAEGRPDSRLATS